MAPAVTRVVNASPYTGTSRQDDERYQQSWPKGMPHHCATHVLLLCCYLPRLDCNRVHYILSTHCARHSGASNGSPKYALTHLILPSCISTMSQIYTRLPSYSKIISPTNPDA
jgi:hypothetical protein